MHNVQNATWVKCWQSRKHQGSKEHLIYLHIYSKCCNLNANKDKDQLPFVTNTQNFLLKKEEQIYHNPF